MVTSEERADTGRVQIRALAAPIDQDHGGDRSDSRMTDNPTSFNTGIAERFEQEPTKQIVTDHAEHGRSGTQTAENDGSGERAPSSTQVDRVDHF
jgi:hypothetical protein